MLTFNLNEQIALLRKQKGITQEELAKALGVTNQSVSKWEAASCCPDIQLLPRIAEYFNVSMDELFGYKSTNTFDHVYLLVKSLFEESPQNEAFTIAYKLSTLLHEGACTKGYKGYVPWDTTKMKTTEEEYYRWGCSVCSEPEGVTIHQGNSVFISDNKLADPITTAKLRELQSSLSQLYDLNTLKVLFGLYELTINDFDYYATMAEITEKYKLTEEAVKISLDNLPIQVKDSADGQVLYRIKGSYMHIPSLLLCCKIINIFSIYLNLFIFFLFIYMCTQYRLSEVINIKQNFETVVLENTKWIFAYVKIKYGIKS